MAKLIIINNIFNPSDQKEYENIKNKKIYEILDDYSFKYAQCKDVEYIFSINGNITDNLFIQLKNDDELLVAPIPKGGGDGKNPLAMVAMLALTVVSGGATAGWLATSGGFFAAGSLSATMLSTGIMMAGGALINSAFPAETPSSNVSNNLSEVSPTYAFGSVSNAAQEGTAYPLILGTMKIVPPILGDYFSTEDDKQYYNAMYVIQDGQIDNITDIKVNDQDINTYDNVSYEIRYGTNDQTAISFYKDRVTHPLNRPLNVQNDDESYTTLSNSLNEVQICMSLPGLYDLSSGKYKNYSLSFEISYKKNSDSDYTVFQMVNLNTVYKTTKKLVYSIRDLPTDKYDIKVKRISSHSKVTSIANDLSIEYINEINYTDFIYPNTAILAIKGMATEDLQNNRPIVKCVVENTKLRYFEDNAFFESPTKKISNPAWACYYALKRANIKDEYINITEFEIWASYCEEEELECNIVLDTIQDLRTALSLLSPAGFASVVQEGMVWTPLVDRAVESASRKFLMTRGNITEDSFSIDYIDYSDRANIIEYTYYDREKDYEATPIIEKTKNYDATSKEMKVSLNRYTCTSRAHAYKEVRRLIKQNERISKTVSLGTSIEGLAGKVGKVINVGYEYLTDAVTDGRLIATTGNTLILDNEFTFEEGKNYNIDIKNQRTDEVFKYQISNTLNTTNEVILTNNDGPVSQLFYKDDIYKVFESDFSETDLFKIKAITSSMDFDYTIVAEEYIPEVYIDDEELPESIVYSPINQTTNLKVEQFLLPKQDGAIEEMLIISWNSNKLSNEIFIDDIKVGTTGNNNFVYKDTFINDKFYRIRVNEIVTTHQFKGTLDETFSSKKVSNLRVSFKDGIHTITWDKSEDINFLRYEFELNDEEFGTEGNSVEFTGLKEGYYKVKIVEVNKLGEKSASKFMAFDVIAEEKSLIETTKDNKKEITEISTSIKRIDSESIENNKAITTTLETISASVNNNKTTIQEVNTIAVQANAWAASSNKFIIDPNGYVTGYSFQNGQNIQSQFKVHADKFVVGSGSTSYTPFIIDGTNIKLKGDIVLTDALGNLKTEVNGNIIKTGKIQSEDGNTFIDLDNNQIKMSDGSFILDSSAEGTESNPHIQGGVIKGTNIYGANIYGANFDALKLSVGDLKVKSDVDPSKTGKISFYGVNSPVLMPDYGSGFIFNRVCSLSSSIVKVSGSIAYKISAASHGKNSYIAGYLQYRRNGGSWVTLKSKYSEAMTGESYITISGDFQFNEVLPISGFDGQDTVDFRLYHSGSRIQSASYSNVIVEILNN